MDRNPTPKPGIQDSRISIFVSVEFNEAFMWAGTNSQTMNTGF